MHDMNKTDKPKEKYSAILKNIINQTSQKSNSNNSAPKDNKTTEPCIAAKIEKI